MALNDLSARLQYLHRAAQMLSDKAPTTSAVLESQYDKTVFDNGLPKPEMRRTEICGSCGSALRSQHAKKGPESIRKPSKRASREQDHPSPVSSAISNSKPESRIIYECPRCNAMTRAYVSEQAQHKNPAARGAHVKGAPLQGQASPRFESSKPPAPSTSGIDLTTKPPKAISKKRVKVSKSGGLQAMLAKRKENPGSESISGLDLMDFMKSA